MARSTSRNIFLGGIVLLGIGIILLIASLPGGHTTVTSGGGMVTTPGNPPLLFVASGILVIAMLICCVAWIGAIIKMVQLRQWVWFILLLAAAGITMLVYIFAGPTTHANAQPYPQYPPNPQYPPVQEYQPSPGNPQQSSQENARQ